MLLLIIFELSIKGTLETSRMGASQHLQLFCKFEKNISRLVLRNIVKELSAKLIEHLRDLSNSSIYPQEKIEFLFKICLGVSLGLPNGHLYVLEQNFKQHLFVNLMT